MYRKKNPKKIRKKNIEAKRINRRSFFDITDLGQSDSQRRSQTFEGRVNGDQSLRQWKRAMIMFLGDVGRDTGHGIFITLRETRCSS